MTKSTWGKVRFTALLLVLLSAIGLNAQIVAGRITGVVRDQSGAVVSGATVTATNQGTSQKSTAKTSNLGSYTISNLPAGFYTVQVAMTGFRTASYTQAKVDAGLEYSLDPVLEIGQTTEVVEVTAGADLVNTTTAQVSNTVTQSQMLSLPISGRDVTNLIRLQAGVQGTINRTNTAINGGRPTWTQVTADGINIQDNYIRTNGLDFLPNRPTSDTVSEFTVTTNNQGADAAGGATSIKMVTASGTNTYHGTLYEFNRNSYLGSNTWLNNHNGVKKPFLNRNQFGGNLGGAIIKNKLFFFGYYEGYRQRQQTAENIVIPAHADLAQGVFRYVDSGSGTVQTVNVLTALPGVTLDPQVQSQILSKLPASSLQNNYSANGVDSTAARLLNTAGYRFNAGKATTRNYEGGRFDYDLNSKHHFEFGYHRLTDVDDRPDIDPINTKSKAFTESLTHRFVGAWRYLVTNNLQNEVRVGANTSPVAFNTTETYPAYLMSFQGQTDPRMIQFLNVDAPYITFLPQGRDTRTYQYGDNATWSHGNHTFQFGGSLQNIKVQPFNAAGQYPVLTTGFSSAAPAAVQLTAANFPTAISSADLASANAMRAFMGGVVSSVAQTFQVKDTTSGYVAGIPQVRNYTIHDWAAYIQDSWRLKSNLTLNLGIKWEYFTPVQEDNGVALLPAFATASSLLTNNPVIDYAKGGMWKPDHNNFGPALGFAWDPWKNGKTSIRGGYTLAFVNEEGMTVANNAAANNSGLTTNTLLSGQYTTVSTGVPSVTAPTYKVPRTLADQVALGVTSAVYGIDVNLKQPMVHQVSFGIQRELPHDMSIEARYVGTMGRGLWRGIDVNQVNAGINQPFLTDFNNARNNGYLSAAAGLGFNPAYNAAVTGSVPLTVLPTFGGGSLNNTTVISRLQQNQAGALADFYLTSGQATAATARAYFMPNPNIYAADFVYNGSNTDYHGAQLEVKRRMKNGLFGQMNYTFSKALADTSGTAQSRLETNLDNARPELERARAEFDITHVINANIVYELPFGRGKKFASSSSIVDHIIGGWSTSSVIHWQGGSPFSVIDARGTFNRGGRSTFNTPNTNLSPDQLKSLMGVRVLPDGRVMYFDPSILDTTGRAVAPDTQLNKASTTFNQVFFNPGAGQVGNLHRLQFDGPSVFSWDMAFSKKTNITERFKTEFRAEMLNFPNHNSFQTGGSTFDWDVTSTTFGQINSSAVSGRVVQLGLRLSF